MPGQGVYWHGWLPAFACSGGGAPWAGTVKDAAFRRLDAALGAYSDGVCREWYVSDRFLGDLADPRIL